METRRKFLEKTLYLAPLIATASVKPLFAQKAYGGDGDDCDDDGGGDGNGTLPTDSLRGVRRRHWRGTD